MCKKVRKYTDLRAGRVFKKYIQSAMVTLHLDKLRLDRALDGRFLG